MGNLLIFCMGVGLCGFFIGAFFEFKLLGLGICVVANCLLFIGASVFGAIAFAKSLEAAQVYCVEDNKPTVKLSLIVGPFSYDINIPVKSTKQQSSIEGVYEKKRVMM